MAQISTVVTTFDRLRNGKPVLDGDPNLGYAASFLYTLTGKKPDDQAQAIALVIADRQKMAFVGALGIRQRLALAIDHPASRPAWTRRAAP